MVEKRLREKRPVPGPDKDSNWPIAGTGRAYPEPAERMPVLRRLRAGLQLHITSNFMDSYRGRQNHFLFLPNRYTLLPHYAIPCVREELTKPDG